MSSPIEKIVLKKFRGASRTTELELDPNKPMVLFFGENGTGKSSIVDAIDLLANGVAGSLEVLSFPGTKSSHLATIGNKPSDFQVEIASKQGSWQGAMAGRQIKITGPDPKPRVQILRRPHLARLVEAQPAQRYEELRRFIDVAGIEKSEQTLREAVKSAQSRLDALSREVDSASDTLTQLWVQEGSPGTTAEAWAKEKSSADTDQLEEQMGALESLIEALEESARAKASLSSAENDVLQRQNTLRETEAKIASAPGVGAEDAVELVTILEEAEAYIAPPKEPEHCPVCEQPVVAANLRESINRRLSSMKGIQVLKDELASAKNGLRVAETVLDTAQDSLVESSEVLLEAAKASDEGVIRDLQIAWQTYSKLSDTNEERTVRLHLGKQLLDALSSATEPLKEKTEELQKDINQFNSIKVTYDKLVSTRDDAKVAEVLLGRLKVAHDIVHDKRIAYTNVVLKEISAECNRLFSRIHPTESLGNTGLHLDPRKKNSLDQKADFEGHAGKPPQAYFSESHLDTLGFCVWLAIAKRNNPAETVLVLDDVLTSVDSAHLTRIVDLLADESAAFAQTIVTTHYRNWRDRYRLGQGAGRNVQLIELHRWALTRGIETSKTKLSIDELKAKLQTVPLDRQGVGSIAGILLEAILDRLALQYGCRVPHKRDADYTLGELWNGCVKTLKAISVQTNGQPYSLLPKVGPIESLSFIRNQVGCHFNVAGPDVSDADVEAFGQATVELAEALTCPHCGDIPGRRKGACFECTCGKAKMTPLERK